MNAVAIVKSFLTSNAYNMLVHEAEHNDNAVELLESINLSLSSLIFFKERNINNRVESETKSLDQTFNYITELYEEQ